MLISFKIYLRYGLQQHVKRFRCRFTRRKQIFWFGIIYRKIFVFFWRSESPSSQRSSPPISPGCEDQILDLPPHLQDPFKKPMPPFRQQDFQHFYSGYPYHLIQHGGSAFHRPLDPSGKPIPVSINSTRDVETIIKRESFFFYNFIKDSHVARICATPSITGDLSESWYVSSAITKPSR